VKLPVQVNGDVPAEAVLMNFVNDTIGRRADLRTQRNEEKEP
jgi:hypothetical protein